jgi:hypothetical protein
MVPGPPQRRLIGHGVEVQSTTQCWSLLQIVDENSLVVPAMELFEQKHPRQLGHIVLGRSCISIVWLEVDVREREMADELLDGLVSIMLEPNSRDGPNVRFDPVE